MTTWNILLCVGIASLGMGFMLKKSVFDFFVSTPPYSPNDTYPTAEALVDSIKVTLRLPTERTSMKLTALEELQRLRMRDDARVANLAYAALDELLLDNNVSPSLREVIQHGLSGSGNQRDIEADQARWTLWRIESVLRDSLDQGKTAALDELFRMRRSTVPEVRGQGYRLMGELSRDSSVAPDIREAIRLELEANPGIREVWTELRGEPIRTQLRAEADLTRLRADYGSAQPVNPADVPVCVLDRHSIILSNGTRIQYESGHIPGSRLSTSAVLEIMRSQGASPEVIAQVEASLSGVSTLEAELNQSGLITREQMERSNRADLIFPAFPMRAVPEVVDHPWVAGSSGREILKGFSDQDLRATLAVLQTLQMSGSPLGPVVRAALDSRGGGRLDVWEEILDP